MGNMRPTPLLSPELCGYGGRAFGRAYDPSELVGDSCVELLGELRWDLPLGRDFFLNQVQLYGYGDHGWLHNIAPVAGTLHECGCRFGWGRSPPRLAISVYDFRQSHGRSLRQ